MDNSIYAVYTCSTCRVPGSFVYEHFSNQEDLNKHKEQCISLYNDFKTKIYDKVHDFVDLDGFYVLMYTKDMQFFKGSDLLERLDNHWAYFKDQKFAIKEIKPDLVF